MTVRTTALIAGVVGVLLLAAGLIADAQRPPREVSAEASLTTPVVVFEPEMIAFSEDSAMVFEGSGDLVAVTARPADAAAWLAGRSATEVIGLPDWEVLATAPFASNTPNPSASPSADAGASQAAPQEPASQATPSPSASAAPEVDLLTETSTDIWREQWTGTGRLELVASDIPAGETLVVMQRNGGALSQAAVGFERQVNDSWIAPLMWWGAVLTVIGIGALILRFVDVRPVQARVEEWRARRRRTSDEDSLPQGGRRARRAAGDLFPESSLDAASTTATEVPAPDTSDLPTVTARGTTRVDSSDASRVQAGEHSQEPQAADPPQGPAPSPTSTFIAPSDRDREERA